MFTTTITATLNPSASRTARHLFYWISTLVLTLIAVLTVLEAFGVYYFPHRSWSEGINANVVQIRGGALYNQYLNVKPSDLRFEFPADIHPMFLGVFADLTRIDARGKLFLRLMTLPEDLFLLAVVWLVRGMILSRLRWIAGFLAALWVYHLFLPTFTDELSFYAGATPNALNNFASNKGIGQVFPWYLSNGYLAVSLLLLILAQVFSHGVRLQKDVEGLV
jgi:hypothetical protein